jgi:hypothetical protein
LRKSVLLYNFFYQHISPIQLMLVNAGDTAVGWYFRQALSSHEWKRFIQRFLKGRSGLHSKSRSQNSGIKKAVTLLRQLLDL